MADVARTGISIRTFNGFSTDADPHDRPPGLARESVNVESHDPGVLRTRKGYRQMTSDVSPGTDAGYRNLTFYDTPHGAFVVGQLEGGAALFLSNPGL